MSAADSMLLIADASLRAAAVLAAGWLVSLTLRRASAATRHFTWLCAIAAAALIPALTLVAPDWHVLPRVQLAAVSFEDSGPVRPTGDMRTAAAGRATVDAGAAPVQPGASPRPSPAAPADLAAIALLVWGLGAAAVAAYGLIGALAAARLRRRAQPVAAPWGDEARALAEAFELSPAIAVVESAMTRMPLVCGAWRPAIVMPREASAWPPARVRAAVLHELAHVKRRDCLTQGLAQAVCAIYWFNPLAWVAARRLRVERERACDDFVLAAGTRGSEYAGHLLEIAGAPGPRFLMLADAGMPMAHRSQLEGRLMAILDPNMRRYSRRATRLTTLVAMGLIAVPVAAVQLQPSSPAQRDVTLAAVTAQPAPRELDLADDAGQAPVERQRTVVVLESPAVEANQRATGVERRAGRALDRALVEAAEAGDVEGILDLLLAGANVNGMVDGDGSPLIVAAREGRLDIVRLLLDRGADPNLAVEGDGNPMIVAAREGHTAIVRLLLDRGADPNLAVPGDGNPMIMAAREGHTAVVELLLQRGAHVDQVVDGDENALITASREGRLAMVKLLVERGADVNARVWVGERIVRHRVVVDAAGQRSLVAVHTNDGEWRSPLSMARAGDFADVVAYLLSVGAQD